MPGDSKNIHFGFLFRLIIFSILSDFFSVEKSPLKYFIEEMNCGNSLRTTSTLANEEERERVYDTIFRLPWRCELVRCILLIIRKKHMHHSFFDFEVQIIHYYCKNDLYASIYSSKSLYSILNGLRQDVKVLKEHTLDGSTVCFLF